MVADVRSIFVGSAFGNDIRISGLASQEFPEARWREAILSYLFEIWSGRPRATGYPMIGFGNITLRLDPSCGLYYAYGIPSKESPGYEHFVKGDEDIHVRSGRKEDVEVGLIRFVKNNRIKLLTLWLPTSGGPVTLWKKPQRSQYGCCASANIPRSFADAERRSIMG